MLCLFVCFVCSSCFFCAWFKKKKNIIIFFFYGIGGFGLRFFSMCSSIIKPLPKKTNIIYKNNNGAL